MRTQRGVLGVRGSCGNLAFGIGQEEAGDLGFSGERLEKSPQESFAMKPEGERFQDLWYGTSGFRPGGDLRFALWALLRKPLGLMDFRPRRIESALSDREMAEFLRERR